MTYRTVGELITALQPFDPASPVQADKKAIVGVLQISTGGTVQIVTGPAPSPATG